MANTYTQLHIHFVFAVKYRAAVIQSFWEERLHKYITGIVQNNGHKMLAVNSAYDHLHMFAGLNPKQSISDLMRLVKGDSSEFINVQKFTPRKFQWSRRWRELWRFQQQPFANRRSGKIHFESERTSPQKEVQR